MSNENFPKPAARRSSRQSSGDENPDAGRLWPERKKNQNRKAPKDRSENNASGRERRSGSDSPRQNPRPGSRKPKGIVGGTRRDPKAEDAGRERGFRSGGEKAGRDFRSGGGKNGRGLDERFDERFDENFDAFERPSEPGRRSGGLASTPATQGEEAVFLPGLKPVLELLEHAPERVDCVFLRKGRRGAEVERILDLCREHGLRFSLLDTDKYAKIYSGKSQGVVARLFDTGFTDLDELFDSVMDAPLPLIVFLDQVQDPGNAGTLARTLYAMGGAGLVIPRHNGVYLGPAARKASAGALERLPVAKAANLSQALDAAAERGITIYGATGARADAPDGKEAVDVFSLTPRLPAVLVLGSEEDGIRPGVRKRCDALLDIPMLRPFDSLNVAQAGAVIISLFSRHVAARK